MCAKQGNDAVIFAIYLGLRRTLRLAYLFGNLYPEKTRYKLQFSTDRIRNCAK